MAYVTRSKKKLEEGGKLVYRQASLAKEGKDKRGEKWKNQTLSQPLEEKPSKEIGQGGVCPGYGGSEWFVLKEPNVTYSICPGRD